MPRGSCLCGTVRYRFDGEPRHVIHCHCGMCRKAHGSPFVTFGIGDGAALTWLQGQDELGEYESSPGARRHFCSRCGSMMPGPAPGGDQVFIPLGTLDDAIAARPEGHMFVASKAPWHEITDDLPQFDAYPPGVAASPIERAPIVADTPGAIAGSCLCAAVRFELIGEPQLLGFCHCSRCRHARAAAHASNLFVRADALRWLAGEDRIVAFDLPGAERFGNDFCRTCGGKVPRAKPGADRVNVPAGSIDGDPGIRPAWHIFVGSKAPWFEITDALPRHREYPEP